MAQQAEQEKPAPNQEEEGISRITVSGYKSISREQSIEVRPLTILAGANSSGKSSIVQPLLLLKQTLEASYDPGALLLNGPNVRFTSADQLFSRVGSRKCEDTFRVGIGIAPAASLTISFHRQPAKGLEISEMTFVKEKETTILQPDMTHEEIISVAHQVIAKFGKGEFEWVVFRNRCFLSLGLRPDDSVKMKLRRKAPIRVPGILPSEVIEPYVLDLIHLPGLRGNPERNYPVTAVGSMFPGTFQDYTASVIAQWQADKQDEKLEGLNKDLERLSLTWKVSARSIDDTQVEIQVGRLPHAAKGGAKDLVSIADVGFGVSQTLPVVVALHTAKPGQLLYLEQPEIHLHPNAQFMMAQVLVDAANRGVRVVVETHSTLLLLGVQTMVAEGTLSPKLLKLHWFKRRKDGTTEVTSADVDEAGTFGDWPEDFDTVELESQSRYLDAAEFRQRGK